MTSIATRAAFTEPANQPLLRFLDPPERLQVSGQQSGGEFALLKTACERGHTAPRHRHRLATETFIVLEGEMLFDVGGERRLAAAGHVAVLPRGEDHTFVVVSATASYLTLHTPAGFEDFVRDVSDAAEAAGAPPAGDALAALAARHGIDIIGPGLTLDDSSRTS
jgi:quercetin dioxygenase-like cupin family protein